MITHPTTKALIQPKPGFGNNPPLVPAPFNAIHIDDVCLAFQALQGVENRSVVAKRQKKTVLFECMAGGFPVKNNRAKGAGLAYRNMNSLYSIPFAVVNGAGPITLTVDGDLPALAH